MPNTVTFASVTPTRAASGAAIQVRANGGTYSSVISGSASSSQPLSPGPNFFEIKVTAQNGLNTRIYTVILNRMDSGMKWASEPGNLASSDAKISADGKFVAFSSRATNLVAGDTNRMADIFVYDRTTNAIERVSISNSGVQGNFDSVTPSISADGRFVAFQSEATNLVSGDTNGNVDRSAGRDIFVYDRTANTIERVSLRASGDQNNTASETPSISGDGRFVAFKGGSSMITGFSSSQSIICIRDRSDNSLIGVSVPYPITPSNRYSLKPAISADGNFVAFEFHTSLNDGNRSFSYRDIYLFNRVTRGVERVTGSKIGIQATGTNSLNPSISADGRYIAFESNLEELDFYDINSQTDVFTYDRIAGITSRVSRSGTGIEELYRSSTNASISGDGRFVAFHSRIANFVPGDTNDSFDVFVNDLTTGGISLKSASPTGIFADGPSIAPSLSFDGQSVAFTSDATNLLASGTTTGGAFVSYVEPLPPSALVDLSQLTSNLGPITPELIPGVLNYNAAVPARIFTALIKPVTADPGASVEVRVFPGEFTPVLAGGVAALPLEFGDNILEIRVTGADSITTQIYSIAVNREAANDALANANLVGLTSGSGSLSPTFDTDTLVYSVQVPFGTSGITLSPMVAASGAMVRINGTLISSGSPSGDLPLNPGSNTFTATVTAPDGITTKSYAVSVTLAADPNADLASLTLSEGSLSPAFSPGITTYTASVPNSVSTITVSAMVAQAEALFTINGSPVESGASSSPISLVVGSNTITVAVIAGTAKTYNVTVTRAASLETAPEIVVEEPVETYLVDGIASLAFGSSNVGTPITKTVTVSNTGTANLTGLAVSRSGTNASEFALGALGSTTLTPGTSTTFTVTFTPTAAGARSAALQIASNDANENPFDIALGGSGVDTGVTAPEIVVEEPEGTNLVDGTAALAFGSSDIGTSIIKTVTIRNTGTANLTGLAATRSGTNASEFSLSVPGSTTLAPGASTTFTVTFTPTAAGTRSAVLQIASNDANENPFDIALGGNGTGIELDPYHLTFVGTPYELRVGNQVTFDLKLLLNPGETIKLKGKIPSGLKYNATTGLLTGIITGKPGTYLTSVLILQGKIVLRTIPLTITVLEFPPSLIGNFDFLMEDADSVPTGVCKITITGANKWSATLESAGASKKRSAKGSFILAEGSPIAPITAVFPAIAASKSAAGVPAVTVDISIDGSTPTITGTYDGGTLCGFRIAKVGEIPPATVAYSLVLDAGDQDGIDIPAGLGWMKGKVSNKGIGAFKGLLGDGTAASMTLRLSAYGQAILWSQPYNYKSSYIGGIVTLGNLGQTTPGEAPLTDEVWWTKTADAKTLSYPNGFPGMPVTVGTSRWTVPASATALGSALGWRDNRTTEVTINGGGLSNQEPQSTTASLPTEFTLDDKFNLITSAPASSPLVVWKGKASKKDGGISGTLTLPTGFSTEFPSGKAVVSGVLVQDESWGTVTGGGQIKVPAVGPKGSFRTSSILLD